MEENARFKVVLSKEARLFLKGLSSKISDKITYNIRKATSVIDPVLFKKLDDTDIWEFRTQNGTGLGKINRDMRNASETLN